jgi:hypothetical protein
MIFQIHKICIRYPVVFISIIQSSITTKQKNYTDNPKTSIPHANSTPLKSAWSIHPTSYYQYIATPARSKQTPPKIQKHHRYAINQL